MLNHTSELSRSRRSLLVCALVIAVSAVSPVAIWYWRAASVGSALAETADPSKDLARGQFELRNGRPALALRSFRRVPPTSPFYPAARLAQAQSLQKLHYFHLAEVAARECLTLSPENPSPVWELLDIYFVQERWTDARNLAFEVFDASRELSVRIPVLLELVRQEFERLSPASAIQVLDPAWIRERDRRTQRALGHAYVKVGRTHEGFALLEGLLSQSEPELEDWKVFINACYQAGDLTRLHEARSRIAAADTADAGLQRVFGLVAQAEGQFEQAIECFQQAIHLDPADRKAHFSLSQVLKRRGDAKRAEEHLRISRELDAAREQLSMLFARTVRPVVQGGAEQSDRLKGDSRGFRIEPLSAQECAEFARICRTLNRIGESDRWAKLAAESSRDISVSDAVRSN